MIDFKYTDLITEWVGSLAASSTLIDYCVDEFGGIPSITVGYDAKKPPDLVADQPFILIVPSSYSDGITEAMLNFHLDIDFVFKDDSYTSSTVITSGENIIISQMNGINKADSFAKIIMSVLNERIDLNIIADRVTIELDNTTLFPFHSGSLSIDAQVEDVIGGTIGLGA